MKRPVPQPLTARGPAIQEEDVIMSTIYATADASASATSPIETDKEARWDLATDVSLRASNILREVEELENLIAGAEPGDVPDDIKRVVENARIETQELNDAAEQWLSDLD
jgi:hypothetical protein